MAQHLLTHQFWGFSVTWCLRSQTSHTQSSVTKWTEKITHHKSLHWQQSYLSTAGRWSFYCHNCVHPPSSARPRAALWLFDRFWAGLDIFSTVNCLWSEHWCYGGRGEVLAAPDPSLFHLQEFCLLQKEHTHVFCAATSEICLFFCSSLPPLIFNVSMLMFFIKILTRKEGKLIDLPDHVRQKRYENQT